ncbi:hypothetical protein FACS189468_1460 [Spirochaetia bacterium]|nr:hypothetical protein FACS189468_1460 [Spirochaetia bacterium]
MEVLLRGKWLFWGLVTAIRLATLPVPGLGAEETRQNTIDVYIIVDGSLGMEKAQGEALTWLCDTIIDGILKEGDRLTIWTAADKAELLYAETITGEGKQNAKALLRSLTFQGNTTDYTGALRAALARAEARTEKRVLYTLLIGGTASVSSSAREAAEASGLLRYSRVENFSGWRVMTVGLGIGNRVRQSAAAFMNSR